MQFLQYGIKTMFEINAGISLLFVKIFNKNIETENTDPYKTLY